MSHVTSTEEMVDLVQYLKSSDDFGQLCNDHAKWWVGKFRGFKAPHWFHFELVLMLKAQTHENSVFTTSKTSRGSEWREEPKIVMSYFLI